MFFFQQNHSISSSCFVIEQKKNFSFPKHIHRCFECIFVTNGQMEIQIGRERKTLVKGEGAFVFPHQVHSLSCHYFSEHILVIFAPELVPKFVTCCKHQVPVSCFFPVSDTTLNRLLELRENSNIFIIKGFLYDLCGIYYNSTTWQENNTARISTKEDLLEDMLIYIETHFQEHCTLSAMAAAIGYDSTYLSKIFTHLVGISFLKYLNMIRINHACTLLNETQLSIIEIASACGYDSLRSFNRNFQQTKGTCPREYQKNCVPVPGTQID